MTETLLLVKEVWCRKARFLLGLGVVAAGVAIIVSVQTVSRSFEEAAEETMRQLGPTTLLLPAELPPTDYLLMNFGDWAFPQSSVETLRNLDLPGIETLEPRLLVEWKLGQQEIVLAGITPTHPLQPSLPNGVVAGAEAARVGNLLSGTALNVNDQSFIISHVLPPRGDATDMTLFFQLEQLQRSFNMVNLINEIGIAVSSAAEQEQLESTVASVLPELRVVTRGRLLQARLRLALGLREQALAIAIVILVLGSLAIANYMANNVRERSREIGTLMALGASASSVLGLFLKKAVAMGALGGLLGFISGTIMAYLIAPSLGQIPIKYVLGLLPMSMLLASGCALAGSTVPFVRVMRTDPATVINQAT